MKTKSSPQIADLVRACQKGNKHAQYQLFKLYFNQMFVICNRIVSNPADAEEVLQDAFVQAFLNLKKLKETAAFGTWLKQIVVRSSVNFVKRSKGFHYKELEENLGEEIPDESDVYQLDDEIVQSAVKQLPEGSRLVFVLHLLEGLKHREIAAMLKISVSTSKSQYQRAKSILKTKLKQYIDERSF